MFAVYLIPVNPDEILLGLGGNKIGFVELCNTGYVVKSKRFRRVFLKKVKTEQLNTNVYISANWPASKPTQFASNLE